MFNHLLNVHNFHPNSSNQLPAALSPAPYPLNILTNGNGNGSIGSTSPLFTSRKQREFIPDSKKDDCYWDRRRRNNEAAKR